MRFSDWSSDVCSSDLLRYLRVSRGHVIEDHITKDRFGRIVGRQIAHLTTDHERKFQLEIHEFRIAGPLDVRPCSDDREAVALVVDWLPIPDWRDGRGCAAVAASRVTPGDRSEERGVGTGCVRTGR